MSGSCSPGADYNTVDSTLFTYDAVGNRTDKGGAYGNANRITTFDTCTYTTDAEGNVTSRTGASCPQPISAIAWTPLGQLDSLIQGTNKVKFFYDALGRLVQKRLNGTVQAYFLWDGDNLLAELNSTAAAVVTEYSYFGPDQPHAVIKQPGKYKYFPRLDGLGNVIALTDTTSTIKRDYLWDDWGKSTGGTDNAGFSGTDRARWKGALWMGSEVDLYYMRNRWYEPHSGRFLSEDPIGLGGGINPVTFAGNDPVNRRDPFGLTTCIDWFEVTVIKDNYGREISRTERWTHRECSGSTGVPAGELDRRRRGGRGGGAKVGDSFLISRPVYTRDRCLALAGEFLLNATIDVALLGWGRVVVGFAAKGIAYGGWRGYVGARGFGALFEAADNTADAIGFGKGLSSSNPWDAGRSVPFIPFVGAVAAAGEFGFNCI